MANCATIATNISPTYATKFSKYNPCANELIPGLPDDMALECLLRVPITSHPTLRLVSHLWKSTVSDPSFFSLRGRGGAAEHLVFLIQPLSPPPPPVGQSKVWETIEVEEKESVVENTQLLYNLSVYNNSVCQEWRNLSDIRIPTFAQCVALPSVGKVIVLGGWDPATLEPVSRVLVIDLVAGTWREGSPMPTARSFFACAAVGPATVYVAGGHDGQKNALRAAEVYDVVVDQWRELPPMAEERDESHGLALGDGSRFWVISGYGTESQGRFRSDAEIYDPDTGTWSRIDGVWPYPATTPKSTAVATIQSQRHWLYIAGGEVREFNFEEMVWKTLNLGQVPKRISGSSSISLVDVGGGEGGSGSKIFVMGNGDNCGEGCKEEGCGGEGVFMLEKVNAQESDKDGVNWSWKHVHASSRFLGFPFSASHIMI